MTDRRVPRSTASRTIRSVLAIELSDVTGVAYQFILDGVARLRAENFMEGNIVLDLTVRDQDVDEEDLLFVLSIDSPVENKKWINPVLSRIQSGELRLVQLALSYGCELAILCRGYKLELIT